ncbi:MAG: DUF805 domain-containing protein [Propionibacteriaceae bacterium]|jgi:uncharacterized membrane protein YhaH (DUF805 family)|nr:DUF805 domain-containing protein [Propionibacteriaceae bacterium]
MSGQPQPAGTSGYPPPGAYGAGPAPTQYAQSPYGQPNYGQAGYGQAYYPVATEPLNVPPIPGVAPALNRPWYRIGPLRAFARAFRKYGTFSGRASRSEFWWFALANVLIQGAFTALITAAVYSTFLRNTGGAASVGQVLFVLRSGQAPFLWVVLALWGVWQVGSLIPTLALLCRRLHDANHSGGWLVLVLLPSLGESFFQSLGVSDAAIIFALTGGWLIVKFFEVAAVITLLVFTLQGPSAAGRIYDRNY